MKFFGLILITALIGCALTERPGYVPSSSSRLKIERPGQGVKLENELARLMLAGKRVQAMSVCNEVLFSSRSKNDREVANYWRSILMALEEIEEGNYSKAIAVFKNGSKWWKNASRDYHSKFLMSLLDSLSVNSKAVNDWERKLKKEKDLKRVQLENLNKDLVKELAEQKKKNEELEKLLRELENVK